MNKREKKKNIFCFSFLVVTGGGSELHDLRELRNVSSYLNDILNNRKIKIIQKLRQGVLVANYYSKITHYITWSLRKRL